jgi:hypothetical protein
MASEVESSLLKCNSCWGTLGAGVLADCYKTSCGHLFCRACSQAAFKPGAPALVCPLCDSVSTELHLLTSDRSTAAALRVFSFCAFYPEDGLRLCSDASALARQQTGLYGARETWRATQECEALKRRLTEADNRLNTMSVRAGGVRARAASPPPRPLAARAPLTIPRVHPRPQTDLAAKEREARDLSERLAAQKRETEDQRRRRKEAEEAYAKLSKGRAAPLSLISGASGGGGGGGGSLLQPLPQQQQQQQQQQQYRRPSISEGSVSASEAECMSVAPPPGGGGGGWGGGGDPYTAGGFMQRDRSRAAAAPYGSGGGGGGGGGGQPAPQPPPPASSSLVMLPTQQLGQRGASSSSTRGGSSGSGGGGGGGGGGGILSGQAAAAHYQQQQQQQQQQHPQHPHHHQSLLRPFTPLAAPAVFMKK